MNSYSCRISIAEYSKVLCSIGHEHTKEDLEELFKQIDEDGGGSLDYAEFADVLKGKDCKAKSLLIARVSELENLFALFDSDGGGTLELGEFANIMQRLGRKPTEHELREGMGFVGQFEGAEFNIDDIELDFYDFVKFVCGKGNSQRYPPTCS